MASIQVGEVRKNPTTGDIEALVAGTTNYVTLYTLDELKGEPGNDGLDGNGAGDMIRADNLANLTDFAAARANIGLAIGSDVMAYSAALDGFTPSNKADTDDSRFDSYTVTLLTAATTAMSAWGRMYRNEDAAARTLTVGTASDGNVNSVHSTSTSGVITLSATGSAVFFVNGSTASTSSVSIAAGGFCTVVCTSATGNTFVVTGSGLS